MHLCPSCYTHGYCRRLTARRAADAELENGDFICDLRRHAGAMEIPAERWREFLVNAYRDYPGSVVDEKGKEVWLDLSCFDDPNIRYWFRDTATIPCRPGVSPRLREESRERFRVMATILRAIDPYGAELWGLRPANDETSLRLPTPLAVPRQACPYPRLFYEPGWKYAGKRGRSS